MRHLLSLKYIDAVARAGSIRRAAEDLAITSTALNRRILSVEEELGVQIFDRLPRGVRLSTAGELMITHVRTHLSDMERLKSQIADLSGVRRGSVGIGATPVALPDFLPEQIARYRQAHPAVTFAAQQRSRPEAEAALIDHTDDLALVFEPIRRPEFQTLASIALPVRAIMRADHPLAGADTLRLNECLQYDYSLPASATGVRDIVDAAAARKSLTLSPDVVSEDAQFLVNHVACGGGLTFDVALAPTIERLAIRRLVAIPLDLRDAAAGRLYLGQLRGRALPVAAARFADQLARAFQHYPS